MVEIIIRMASIDTEALAADPSQLQLYPAIPVLSKIIDLDLSPAQTMTMNTTVFAALSSLGLHSAEGRLKVCLCARVHVRVAGVRVCGCGCAGAGAGVRLRVRVRERERGPLSCHEFTCFPPSHGIRPDRSLFCINRCASRAPSAS